MDRPHAMILTEIQSTLVLPFSEDLSFMQDRTSSICPCSVPFHGREIAHAGCYDLLPFNPDTMEFVRVSGSHFRLEESWLKVARSGWDAAVPWRGMFNGIRIPGKVSHPWHVLRSVGCCSRLISSLGLDAT